MQDTLAAREPLPAADPPQAWRSLHEAATAPYRASGRFAWHFARGKLGRDPVFRALVEGGHWLPAAGPGERPMRVVDIGCGQGLMASLLHACAASRRERRWPASWPLPPHAVDYTGIELMPRDVARGRTALAGLQPVPRFVEGDMRTAALPGCDLVVILDVLHYVDHADQRALLQRVRAALPPGGRLLLRVGDAAQRGGFRASQWVDRCVTWVRGHRAPPTWGRPLAEWTALLRELGFSVRSEPMSRGTPFANVLLVADAVGAAEAA